MKASAVIGSHSFSPGRNAVCGAPPVDAQGGK